MCKGSIRILYPQPVVRPKSVQRLHVHMCKITKSQGTALLEPNALLPILSMTWKTPDPILI